MAPNDARNNRAGEVITWPRAGLEFILMRGRYRPDYSHSSIGFRVALEVRELL
jgi:hypothetical protein